MPVSAVAIPNYDNFVSYCVDEYSARQADEALKYFDNRFFNRRQDNQTGHLRQAFYAGQEFFRKIPKAARGIQSSVKDGRLDFANWRWREEWKQFFFCIAEGNCSYRKGGTWTLYTRFCLKVLEVQS